MCNTRDFKVCFHDEKLMPINRIKQIYLISFDNLYDAINYIKNERKWNNLHNWKFDYVIIPGFKNDDLASYSKTIILD